MARPALHLCTLVIGAALSAYPGTAAHLSAQRGQSSARLLVRPESDSVTRAPHAARRPAPAASATRFTELKRFSAPEAGQGVAVDERFFYAIGNFVIAKYDKQTGTKVSEWRGQRDGPIVHLNSCSIIDRLLHCAHSNHPGIPMLSSVEVWDPETLQHVRSHSFGNYEGSLTWVDRRDGEWWAVFAHYANYSGVPGRGSEWSSLVRFDAQWNRRAAYAFPVELVDIMTPNASSGGAWGADGRLYVTGHDAREVYVLQLPKMGSVLEWVETIPAPIEGQAWAWDRSQPGVLYGITRAGREVVAARLETTKSDR